MIRVGCAGYPVGRDRYWSALDFLEAPTGKGLPRPATLDAWRADVPKGAEVAVQALRLITHSPGDAGFPAEAARALTPARRQHCGAFRDTLEVYEAWLATKVAAEALGATLVVFDLPASLPPGPDRLRDLYRFFKGLSRGRLRLVWSPRGREWASLAEKVSGDLGLVRAFDPLREAPPRKGGILYMRPGVPLSGTLSVDNMSTIRAALDERPAYAVLSHRAAFRDAERLRGAAGAR